MRIVVPTLAVLVLSGCGPSWADMGGTILGSSFDNPKGVYFGGANLVITDRDVGCDTLGWTDTSYVETEPPNLGNVVALHITLQNPIDADAIGAYELDSAGGTDTWALSNPGDSFQAEPAREGILEIESVDGDEAEGTLSVAFGNDGVGGRWHAMSCRSLSL